MSWSFIVKYIRIRMIDIRKSLSLSQSSPAYTQVRAESLILCSLLALSPADVLLLSDPTEHDAQFGSFHSLVSHLSAARPLEST